MSKTPLATKTKTRISPVTSSPPHKGSSVLPAPMSTSQLPDTEPVVTSPSASPSQLSDSTPDILCPPSNAVTSTAVVNPQQIQHLNRPSVQKNVPAFLNKLFNMVDDPASNELIRWGDDGLSFLVNKHQEFAKEVLPRFFKHNNFASFVRQLNMYGFHKVPHLQQGVLQATEGAEQWEFSNQHFQRNQPDLLVLVTRKRGTNADDIRLDLPPGLLGTSGGQGVDLSVLLNEIAAIKKHQLAISSDLKNIQRDNQIFWQETLSARERHERHQETIDKILRFLASVFSQDRKRQLVPRKRRLLLGGTDPRFEGLGNGDQTLTGKEEIEEEIEMRKEGSKGNGNSTLETGMSDKSNTDSISANLSDFGNSNGSDGISDDTDVYINNFGILPSKAPTNDAITKSQAPATSTDDGSANPYIFLTLQNLQNMIASASQSGSLPTSALPNTSNGAIPSKSAPAPSVADLSLLNMGAIPQFPLPPTVPRLPTHLIPTPHQEPRINLVQHTQNIANAAKSAETVSEDMDTLHANMESLANQLGYISTDQLADADLNQSALNYMNDNWPLEDSSNLGFTEDVDMDQLLREFVDNQPSSPVLATNPAVSASAHPSYKHSVFLEEPPSKKSKISDEAEEGIF